jgi:hypothetical protein
VTKNHKFKIRPIPTHNKRAAAHFENGKTILPHELDTVKVLSYFGFDIVCKQESNVPYEHTADIVWKNEVWELKGITGDSRHTIRNNLRKAKKQSQNIVLDISNSKIQMNSAINHTVDRMKDNKQIKKVLIVDKTDYCIIEKGLL